MQNSRVRKRTVPALVLALIGLGGCGAVALWWGDTLPFTPSWGNELTNAGRILGLLAGYLVAVQLILMARIPWLDQALGPQRLASWHASIGRYVVITLVGHAAAVILGYSVTLEKGPVEQTIKFWTSYSYVALAMVGLVMLVIVGVMSARAVRKRVSYETWYLIHLLTYVAIGLSFWHGMTTGAEFAYSTRNRIFWSTLYIVAFGCILVFRVTLPLARMIRMNARVRRVVRETQTAVSIHIEGRRLPPVRPGQFVRMRVLSKNGWWHSHPFSVSAPSTRTHLRVTVNAAGSHTRSLADVVPETRVLLTGPYGALTADRRRRQRVLLVAGGIGVTPLLPLLQTLPADPGDVTLIYRASDVESLALKDEIDATCLDRGMTVHYILGPRGSGEDDPISAAQLDLLVPDLADHDVFICGPDGLVDHVRESLRSRGVSSRSIHVEQFAF